MSNMEDSLQYPHLDGSDSDGGVGIPPFEEDMGVHSFASGGFATTITDGTLDQDDVRPMDSASMAIGVHVAAGGRDGFTTGLEGGAGSPPQLRFPIVGSLSPSSEVGAQSWTFPNQGNQGPNIGATIRQEYEQMQTAKAKGEERVSTQQDGFKCFILPCTDYSFLMLHFVPSSVQLKQYTASKEHAKRAFPRIRQVWKDYYLTIMVSALTTLHRYKRGLSSR